MSKADTLDARDLDSRNCTYLSESLIFDEKMNCITYLHYVDERKNVENQLFEYWIIVASIYIILMSLGFFMVEVGLVRKRNQMNIISKNFLSLFITALVFYLWGYSLSTTADGGIIGGYVFSYVDTSPQEYLDWFYKFSVSGISASIVSGCLAERMHVSTYMMFTLVMSGAIYPIAASWCLGGGWLNALGFVDAAGAGYIHMIGGVSGLVGTIILGPRFGIFDTRQQIQKKINQRQKMIKLNKGGRNNYLALQEQEGTYESDTNQKMEKFFYLDKANKINNNQYFYNHGTETAMKQRVMMLKKLFNQFSELKEDQCIKLINTYDQNIQKHHAINSKEIFIIGNLTLIIGWLIFNACAVMFTQYEYGKGFEAQFYNDIKHSPQHAVIASILSSSFSVISTYIFYDHFPVDEEQSPSDKCITVVNASRAGLVMITGTCDSVSLYSACSIGAYAGIVYLKIRQIFIRNSIDDPMQSAQIHGICGFFGVLNAGIFGQNGDNLSQMSIGGTTIWTQIMVQLLGAISLVIWAMCVSYAFFKVLSNMGHLRVGQFYEIVGIDILTHTMSDLIGIEDTFLRDSKKYEKLNKMQKMEDDLDNIYQNYDMGSKKRVNNSDESVEPLNQSRQEME